MKIHPAAQGTMEWLQARAGIPTASELDNLVSPTFKIRTGQMPETYLHKKVAEYWQGGPLPSWQKQQTPEMEFGQILEERARAWFTVETGIDIYNCGLCLTDDEKFGCSPDGLILKSGRLYGENYQVKPDDVLTGIELKCPAIHTHVSYLLDGFVPDEYKLQVQGCMYVTGCEKWHFVSYGRARFPKLIIEVPRDDAAQSAIFGALEQFRERFSEAVAKMERLNGGPRPTPTVFDPLKYSRQENPQDEMDIVP